MRITKFGHAGVRISHEGTDLVLDPGGFTQPEAVDGVAAVLLTHEHPDHLDVDNLRRADAGIFTIAAVADAIAAQAPDLRERVTVVAPGESFEAAGIAVRAVGEKHAEIHPAYDLIDNSGYLLELGGPGATQRVFHPGDALTGPGEPIDVLLAPVCAPWLKISEAIEFARGVAAPVSLAIHDRIYSEAGLGVADAHFGRLLEADGLQWARRADGDDL